ncbi:hypothetical protein F2Q68_00041386 [Brassica cretica]|uniref:Uncharacterized protein n=2 Tax=Brassica cretica TaxID=69181 RepID=A0ABQ7A505_BRACR|nr:hypothetical protein F2Q68_00041386 [Brassica cretica]KAF3492744.1 hypothetical protein DY000_02055929 [Brassica cretica]
MSSLLLSKAPAGIEAKGARFAIREIHYFQFRRLIKLLPNRLDVGSVWDQTCIHQHQLLYLIITKTKAEQLSQEWLVMNAHALKGANIGIDVVDATNAAQGASDIVLTES